MRFTCVLLMAVWLGGCGLGHVTLSPEPLPGEPVLGLATAVVLDGPRLAEIWPDYWSEGQPFAIGDSQSTIVYKPYGAVPPGYGAVPERPGYWVYRGLPTSLARRAVDLRYDVGDAMVTAVRVDTSEAEALDLLFHEAFHVYQETRFGDGKRFTWGSGFRDTVAGEAPQERELLRCATTAGDLDDVRRYASEYVRHRLVRMATEQDGIVQAEHRVERKEGTAQWVGMKMQGVVLGRTEPVVRRAIADLLDWEYPAQPVQMFADGLPFDHRQSLYATGAAIIELLARLEPGPWQDAIAGGFPPFQVLVQALGDADLPGKTTSSDQDEVDGKAEWPRCTNGV